MGTKNGIRTGDAMPDGKKDWDCKSGVRTGDGEKWKKGYGASPYTKIANRDDTEVV
jgi:hypothetical protein